MRRRSSRSNFDDPRENERVYVSPYQRKDGTEVSEHDRRAPLAKGKFKFEYPGRIKGKVKFYDDDGRKVNETTINQPLVLNTRTQKETGDAEGK